MSEKIIKDLKDLNFLQKEIRQSEMDKKDYQEYWKDNKSKFRKMIASKNKKWLDRNKNESEFKHYKEYTEVFNKLENMFGNESSRKFLIHTITNFFPLNNCRQVPRLSKEKTTCDITSKLLTDLDEIKTGKNDSRNKHIAYTGKRTTVVLCGIAVQELERFVIKYVNDFDSQYGQIINHALDKIRNEK
jgi:hypothetical protein